MSEEEAYNLGFRKDSNGNWSKPPEKSKNSPSKKNIRPENTRKSDGTKRVTSGRTTKKQEGAVQSLGSEEKGDSKKAKKRSNSGTKGVREHPRYKIVVIAKRMNATRFDPDNLIPKWYIDEIVRAGVIPDDKTKYIESVEKMVKRANSKEDEETIIEIYQIDEI